MLLRSVLRRFAQNAFRFVPHLEPVAAGSWAVQDKAIPGAAEADAGKAQDSVPCYPSFPGH